MFFSWRNPARESMWKPFGAGKHRAAFALIRVFIFLSCLKITVLNYILCFIHRFINILWINLKDTLFGRNLILKMEMERIVQALRILKVEEESKAAERRSRRWRDAWETGEADWRKIDYDIDADCGLCRSDLRGRDFRRSVSDFVYDDCWFLFWNAGSEKQKWKIEIRRKKSEYSVFGDIDDFLFIW